MNKFIKTLRTHKTIIEASRYFVVGGICTVLDMAALFSITHFLKVEYIFSSVISFMMGATLNYFLCTSWIFDIRLIENRHHEFIYYLLITAFVLAVNTAMMWWFTAILGFYFMVSKIAAVFVTFGLNFSLRKYLLHTN